MDFLDLVRNDFLQPLVLGGRNQIDIEMKKTAIFCLGLMFGILIGVLIVEAGLKSFQPASISPVLGAGSMPPAPLSILDAEEKFNCEILHPTVRELQEHINRHGGLRGEFIAEDNRRGPETIDAAKWLRCNQEAVKIWPKEGRPK